MFTRACTFIRVLHYLLETTVVYVHLLETKRYSVCAFTDLYETLWQYQNC